MVRFSCPDSRRFVLSCPEWILRISQSVMREEQPQLITFNNLVFEHTTTIIEHTAKKTCARESEGFIKIIMCAAPPANAIVFAE